MYGPGQCKEDALHRDNTAIPLVLTYHPAFFKVYDILKKCLNALFVNNEHQQLFKDKIFVSFRRAKNLKDTLVRAKVYEPSHEQTVKGTFRCNGRKNCQICALILEGGSFQNHNDSRSFTISSGAFHCNSENVIYLLQCECCNKKYVGSTKTKFRQRFNVYKSYFRTYARKHNEGSLDRGKAVPQAGFFGHFFSEGHQGAFSVGV